MPQPPDPNLPESVVLSSLAGLKNTVTRERLAPQELELAVNIDIDDSGQARRRRGYDLAIAGEWHSIRGPLAGKVYGVKDGYLGIIRPGLSFYTLGVLIGASPACFTEVNDEAFFSSTNVSGVVGLDEVVRPWGHTDGQGAWFSPVYTPTDTLGEVGGSLLGDPPKATQIEAYKGRIYLARGKMLWATELFRYHYIDRTRGFFQFEHEITFLAAMGDGLYVGTTGGLYFMQGTFETFKLQQLTTSAVLPGSGVFVPTNLVHPQARNQDMPTGLACLVMTNDGLVAGFDGGTCYNLTQGRVNFPKGISAAGLYREDQGANHYVAVVDSAGAPTANARIGDYIDAEIIRAVDR